MTRHEIEITVNGRKRRVSVYPNELLLNVIRNDMALTGTKYGCGIGECAACTVLLDGKAVLACLILAVAAHGKNITTIEGLAKGTELAPIQQAFIDEGAIQCGFCTPGMVLTSQALLNENPSPTEDEIRDYLRGNHCRCTGYTAIVKAVQSVKERGHTS
ncbi:(2Fe-2S)-binding protein [Candidatus Formimonas warabiya]|uniref:(2Fe-2S)-binding protein n=1 Tax=Formimonas warabiya TaxID=1761012 RepID=A0A3G1KQX7_FORW1|nr:(2Fe-2S)-binding protein [Candidatus Formimonas warabiya]ATW24882.1 (2Fe-2S)-binding protein [Candidatus Formimonas warabiya]